MATRELGTLPTTLAPVMFDRASPLPLKLFAVIAPLLVMLPAITLPAKFAVLPEMILPDTVPFDVMSPFAMIVVLEYIVSEVTAPFDVMLPPMTLPAKFAVLPEMVLPDTVPFDMTLPPVKLPVVTTLEAPPPDTKSLTLAQYTLPVASAVVNT